MDSNSNSNPHQSPIQPSLPSASPGPSPALSAYSSSSSSSGISLSPSSSCVDLDLDLEEDENDPALDSLTIDDWGYQRSSHSRDPTQTQRSTSNNLNVGTVASARGTSGPKHDTDQLQNEDHYESRHLQGTSTPIAAAASTASSSGSSRSDSTNRRPSNSTSLRNQSLSNYSIPSSDSTKTSDRKASIGSNQTQGGGGELDETFDPLDYDDVKVGGNHQDLDEDEVDPLVEDGEGEEDEVFDLEDDGEEDMHANGVPAARGWKLDPRKADTPAFRTNVLQLFSQELKLKGWTSSDITPSSPFYPLNSEFIHLKRISGAFTNAVFFVSYRAPSEITEKAKKTVEKKAISGDEGALISNGSTTTTSTPPPTVLLRVYGIGSEVLLSRRAELLILHTLSSLYEIGPHILGTFGNGRVEEYYECKPLTIEGMRDLGDREESIIQGGSLLVRGKEGTSQWVARRMRELHEVPLDVMKTVLEQGDLKAPTEKGFGRGIENHIMASSHRPRRRRKERKESYNNTAFNNLLHPTDSQEIGAMRDSPAPLTPQDTSIASAALGGAQQQQQQSNSNQSQSQNMQGFSPHRNSSVASIASFDSLATSFNSQSSFSSSSSESLLASPPFAPKSYGSPGGITPMGLSSSIGSISGGATGVDAGSYFTARRDPYNSQMDPTASPFAFSTIGGTGRSRGGSGGANRRGSHSSSGNHPRGPYPGVWRRIKRWSREAAKVLALVETFCKTPEGAEACKQALALPPSEAHFSKDNLENGILCSENIGNTKGNLRATLKCIAAIDLPQLVVQLDKFKKFVRNWERREGLSKRVFSHNDAQPGNLLIIQKGPECDGNKGSTAVGMPRVDSSTSSSFVESSSNSISSPSPQISGQDRSHPRSRSKNRSLKQQPPHNNLVVIDFEYASPNPRGYDIANHFHEWRSDYHHPTKSWSLTHHGSFPNDLERKRWLRAYVEQGRLLKMKNGGNITPPLSFNERNRGNSISQIPEDLRLPPSVLSNNNSSSSSTTGGNASQSDQISSSTSDTSVIDSPAINPADSEETQRALEKSNGRLPASRNASSNNLEPNAKVNSTSTDSNSTEEKSSRLGFRGTIRAAASAAIHRHGHHSSSSNAATAAQARNPSLSPSVHAQRTTIGAENSSNALVRLENSIEREVERLEKELRMWSPASHAVWGLWGIVFAREEIELVLENARQSILKQQNPSASGKEENIKVAEELKKEPELGSAEDFDNLRYSLGRIELFRLECQDLGLRF